MKFFAEYTKDKDRKHNLNSLGHYLNLVGIFKHFHLCEIYMLIFADSCCPIYIKLVSLKMCVFHVLYVCGIV